MTAAVVAGSLVTSSSQSSTLDAVVQLPAGALVGELVAVTIRHQGSGADPLSVPADWTPLINVASATNQRAMAVLVLPVTATTSVPATITLTRSTTAGRYVAHAFRISGADVDAFDGGGSSAYSTTAPTYTLSEWQAATAPGLAVYVAAHDVVAGTPAVASPASWSGPAHVATSGSGGDSTAVSTTWLSTATLRVSTTTVPAGSATWNRGGGAGAAVGALIVDKPPPPPAAVERPAVDGIDVRTPTSSDWLDALAVDASSAPPAYTLTATAGALTLPIDYLVPGKPYTLQLRASAVPAAGSSRVTLVLEGSARRLDPGDPVWLEWVTTSTRPVQLDVRGVDRLTVHELYLVAPAPAGRGPGAELSLELLLPRAGADVFVLDSSRLDRAALTAATPWPGTFVLDSSRLDEGYLYLPELSEWWHPVLPLARAVSTRRGSSVELVPVAQAGTLVAEFPNALDPRAHAIRRGTPVRLFHWPTRRPLFTGEVARAGVSPERPGRRLRYVTTLEAVDVVAQLVETTRYGAIVGAGLAESWRDRIARLLSSAPDVSWRIVPAVAERAPTMANTVLESSLAKHLDVAVTSARGVWFAGADGTVRICPGEPAGDDVALFTDTHSTDPLAWPYVDAHAGWDTDAIVSVVELTNLGATQDGAGEWTAADVVVSVTDATLAATYGRRLGSGTVNVAAGEAEAIAGELVRGLDSGAAVSRVTLDAGAAMARASELELFAPVRAQLRGELREALVTAITHSIKPRRWSAGVELTDRSAS